MNKNKKIFLLINIDIEIDSLQELDDYIDDCEIYNTKEQAIDNINDSYSHNYIIETEIKSIYLNESKPVLKEVYLK